MIGNKIANKITKMSRNTPQNSSETVTKEAENIGLDREISKERYIPRKSVANYWRSKINMII